MVRSFVTGMAAVALVACTGSAPEAEAPRTSMLSFGFAWQPGQCVEGQNVVPASAYVSSPDGDWRHLSNSDGQLRLTLVLEGRAPRPVAIEWLPPPVSPETPSPLPGRPWNLELTFDSPRAGECPLQVHLEPSAAAAQRGLRPAHTTVLLTDPPAPPPSP